MASMEDRELQQKIKEILALKEERKIYAELSATLKAHLESVDEEARARLLEQFDEAMREYYAVSDDYRNQASLFKISFARLYKEFHFTYLALQAKMDEAEEEEHGRE